MPEIDFDDLKKKITLILEYLSLSNNEEALTELNRSNHRHSLISANPDDQAKKRRRKSKELKTENVAGVRIRLAHHIIKEKSWAWRKFGVQIEKKKDGNTLYYRKNTQLIEEIEKLTQDLITKCNNVFPVNISLYEKASKLLSYFLSQQHYYIIEKASQSESVNYKTLYEIKFRPLKKNTAAVEKIIRSRNQMLSRDMGKLVNIGLMKRQIKGDNREKHFSIDIDLLDGIYDYSCQVTSLFYRHKNL